MNLLIKVNYVHVPLATGKADSSQEGSLNNFARPASWRLFLAATRGDLVVQLCVVLHHQLLKL